MKFIFKITLIATLLLPNLLFANGKEERGVKSVISYTIKSRTTNSSLAKNTGKFKVSLYTEKGLYKNELSMGINDSSFQTTPNELGWVNSIVKKGKYKLYFYVDGYYEVITDSIDIKSKEVVEIEVKFQKADPKMIYTVDKPVIYVYPTEKIDVNIQLNTTGKLNFTYPDYNEGWNFIANPDGNISMNGKEYNYLFWESEMPENLLEKSDNTGFLVETGNLLSFLEKSLSQMGLNSKEQADFITYWYPRMMVNEKNHIHFMFNEACDSYAELKITPQPENIFRVGMVWANATSDFVPQPQEISSLNRTGFTVIEWGGTEVSTLFNPEK